MFSCEVYPATTGAHIVARKRGLTRTLSYSLARYNRQATSVALCISEIQPAPPHRTARYNPRSPPDSSINDSVALQDDWKPDFDDDLDAAMVLSGNTVAASTGNKGSHTIEFYALDMGSSPHDFHGIIDKWEIPPQK